MDPRKAATITAADMNKAFAEGFGEGRDPACVGEDLLVCVQYSVNGTVILERIYAVTDIEAALGDVIEHLEHGTGMCVQIEIVAALVDPGGEQKQLPTKDVSN